MNTTNVTVYEKEDDGKGSDNTLTWIVVLVLAIILISILILKEMRSRVEQKKMDEKFFKEGEGPERGEMTEEDVEKYMDMFTVGGAKDPKEKEKKGGKKKDPFEEPLPDVTVGGMKVRKKGGKKDEE